MERRRRSSSGQWMTLQKARAGVPAHQDIVVAWWPQRLGPGVPVVRLGEQIVGHATGARSGSTKQHLGPPLADDPGVIGTLVLILDAGEHLTRPGDAVWQPALELVGDGQHKADDGLLVAQVYVKHVTVDTLGFPGLIQQPIALRLRERTWNATHRQEFDLEHGRLPPSGTERDDRSGPTDRASTVVVETASGSCFKFARRPAPCNIAGRTRGRSAGDSRVPHSWASCWLALYESSSASF